MKFDGVTVPQVITEIAFGGPTTVDPSAGYFVLGTSLLDTGILGSVSWVDISTDVVSIGIRRGTAGEIETPSPGTCTIVLDNTSGAYDPLNVNLVTNAGFETDTTGWIAAGGAVTLSRSTAQAYTGVASLRVDWPTSSGLYGPNCQVTGLQIGSTYTFSAWVYVQSGPAVVQLVAAVAFGGTTSATGVWQQLSMTFTATSTSHALQFVTGSATTAGQFFYVDEVVLRSGDNPAFVSPYGRQMDVGVPVWIQAVWNNTAYPLFRGYLDAIDADMGNDPTVTLSCVDGLESLGRAYIDPIAPAFDNDLTGTRVARILNAAGWPTTLRSLDAGLYRCQSTAYGDTALQLLTQVAETELGLISVDAAGNLVFYDRVHVYQSARSMAVQATLTDSGSGVDMIELTMSKHRDAVFNQARITRTGGTEQVANDPTSQTLYGIRTFSGSAGTLLRTDADAFGLASWLVGRFRNPTVRVTQVRVEAATQGQWSSLLPLTYLDRLRIVRDYGPSTVDIQLIVQAMAQDISVDSWTFTFDTRNADVFIPFILNTSLLDTGQLS